MRILSSLRQDRNGCGGDIEGGGGTYPAPDGRRRRYRLWIFDSVFNSFRGIIAYFKIENGVIRKGDKVKFFNTGKGV